MICVECNSTKTRGGGERGDGETPRGDCGRGRAHRGADGASPGARGDASASATLACFTR